MSRYNNKICCSCRELETKGCSRARALSGYKCYVAGYEALEDEIEKLEDEIINLKARVKELEDENIDCHYCS